MKYHRAKVHFNADSSLCVMPDLLEKKFGIQKQRDRGTKWVGTCFVAQIAFSISALTGIKPMTISKHIFDNIGAQADQLGWTLAEIMCTFELPVLTRQGPKWLDLDVTVYENVQAIAEAVIEGHPVIMVLGREACDAIECEAGAYKDGSSFVTAIRPANADRYHTYLAIGYEVKSDANTLSDFFILRDSRHTYCLDGYLKLSPHIVHQGINFIRALSVNVRKVEG